MCLSYEIKTYYYYYYYLLLLLLLLLLLSVSRTFVFRTATLRGMVVKSSSQESIGCPPTSTQTSVAMVAGDYAQCHYSRPLLDSWIVLFLL